VLVADIPSVIVAAARDADLQPILEAILDRTYREIAEELTGIAGK
jgi:hypothetical protein